MDYFVCINLTITFGYTGTLKVALVNMFILKMEIKLVSVLVSFSSFIWLSRLQLYCFLLLSAVLFSDRPSWQAGEHRGDLFGVNI